MDFSKIAGLLPFIFIFFIFYFMLIRPQVKKQKEHANMLENLKKGDKVVTSGGIIGNISKIDKDIVKLEIAQDLKIEILKGNIVSLM